MQKLIVDRATRSKLHEIREPLELCDESGHVLGYLTPASGSLHHSRQSPHDEDELRRREQETETYSTDEVLAHLEKL